MDLPPLVAVTRKERRVGVAWRAVRRKGGGELARSSLKRLREAGVTIVCPQEIDFAAFRAAVADAG